MSTRLPMLPAPPVSERPVMLATIKAQMFAALLPCRLEPGTSEAHKKSLDDMRSSIANLEAAMAAAEIAPFSVADRARWNGERFVVVSGVPRPTPLVQVPKTLRLEIMETITSMDIPNMPRRRRASVIVRRQGRP